MISRSASYRIGNVSLKRLRIASYQIERNNILGGARVGQYQDHGRMKQSRDAVATHVYQALGPTLTKGSSGTR